MYLITRDGFMLLAMGFTGKKAMQFKLAYIEAFNQMEQELKEGLAGITVAAEPANLLASTAEMLHSINLRIRRGENVPPHILKYA